MDVKIVNPFLSAGLSTFEQMFGIKSEAHAPFIVNKTSGHPWEVSGLLGLSGDANGIVAFRLNKTLANKMLELSGLVEIKEEEKSQLAEQLVSEFTNIIASAAVTSIKTAKISVTPPSILTGHNHLIAWPKNYPVVGIPFATNFGSYEVDVCFKEDTVVKRKVNPLNQMYNTI